MNKTLCIGDIVRCSDGTPEPPIHHKKKHRHWQLHNFTGLVHSIDPKWNRVGIDPDGNKIMVLVMDATTHTITKIGVTATKATTPPINPANQQSEIVNQQSSIQSSALSLF